MWGEDRHERCGKEKKNGIKKGSKGNERKQGRARRNREREGKEEMKR